MHSRLTGTLWVHVVVAVVCCAAAVPLSAAVTLTFEPAAVIASGITPGAKTMWMVVSYEPKHAGYVITDDSFALVDSDNDGVVRFEYTNPAHPIANQSVWVVVDLESRQFKGGTPADPQGSNILTLPAASITRRLSTSDASVSNSGRAVAFWCVRASLSDAWRAISDDATATDMDNLPNRRVSSRLRSMQAVDTTAAAPDDFAANDIIVAVDLFTLQTSIGIVLSAN
ncbi:MAG TPA: hypothetical protein VF824_16845 [Thermoanaerobaculia bacterium]|jgi:hypothetical protein